MYKRLCYQSHDCGYTECFDMGVKKAFEEGISTHADTMFDSPDTVEFLKWLKDRPWISLGWHDHFWESPVAPREMIPHMIDEEGRFVWRHRNQQWKDDVPYMEAYTEFKAEMEQCFAACGRYPDIAMSAKLEPRTEFEKAFKDICDELHIMYGWQVNRGKQDPKYAHLKFGGKLFTPMSSQKDFKPSPFEDKIPLQDRTDFNPWKNGTSYNPTYDLAIFKDYHCGELLKTLEWETDDTIVTTCGHTGFLDDHILEESSATIHRVEELRGCIDPTVRAWVIENKIELINMKDALTGSHDYQDHLKEINSDLWVGNY